MVYIVHGAVYRYHNIIIIIPETFRRECSLLRQELSQRHSEDSKAALSELASLKDSAMKQAKLQWDEEQANLLKKVNLLNDTSFTVQDCHWESLGYCLAVELY